MFKLDPDEVRRGSEAFRKNERRDAMYKVAAFLMGHFWGDAGWMADSLGVLLLTWNNACYRYGSFDFAALERALREHMPQLAAYRDRSISAFVSADEPAVRAIFDQFLDALQIAEGKKCGVKSPVGVAKALHILAPRFFPLWDDKIAKAYGCRYAKNPATAYLEFMKIAQDGARQLGGADDALKVIDEYNYAKYTKKWI